jgi:hypothetical protein
MFPTVVEPTVVVFTVKFAEVVLAGTVTELGTVAAGLALDSVTTAPLAGASPNVNSIRGKRRKRYARK